MTYTSTGIGEEDNSKKYEGELDILGKISEFKHMLLLTFFILILLYYYIFPSIDSETTPSYIQIICEITLWSTFTILLILNVFSYIFKIDVIQTLRVLFGGDDTDKIASMSEPEKKKLKIKLKKQVFHIPSNTFTFNDSKLLCDAYDSKLASFDEIEKSYEMGSDWCGYGWSEGQMALYPTQRDKWNKLQTKKGHENDCGHPGINGGYISDENIKLGVNCYGFKPSIRPIDASLMENNPEIPKTCKEKQYDTKVNKMKGLIDGIEVAPFNHNNWSVL